MIVNALSGLSFLPLLILLSLDYLIWLQSLLYHINPMLQGFCWSPSGAKNKFFPFSALFIWEWTGAFTFLWTIRHGSQLKIRDWPGALLFFMVLRNLISVFLWWVLFNAQGSINHQVSGQEGILCQLLAFFLSSSVACGVIHFLGSSFLVSPSQFPTVARAQGVLAVLLVFPALFLWHIAGSCL